MESGSKWRCNREILASVEKNFDYQKPYASLPKLLDAYQLIQKLEDGYWKQVKRAEIKDVIKACLGLYLEATADDYSATKGDEVEVTLEIVNRSPAEVTLKAIKLLPFKQDTVTQSSIGKQPGIQVLSSIYSAQKHGLYQPILVE